jgi:hypothetical protein
VSGLSPGTDPVAERAPGQHAGTGRIGRDGKGWHQAGQDSRRAPELAVI